MSSQASYPAQSWSTPVSGPQKAALRGASLAFQNQAGSRSAPSQPGAAPARGALIAASAAASAPGHSRPISSTPQGGLSRHTTGGSAASEIPVFALEHTISSQPLQLSARSNSPQIRSSDPRPGLDGRSASFIAATLAASRSTSPSPSRHRAGRGSAASQGIRTKAFGVASLATNPRPFADGEKDLSANRDENRSLKELAFVDDNSLYAPWPVSSALEDTDPLKSPRSESLKALARSHGANHRQSEASDELSPQRIPVRKLKEKPIVKPKPKIESKPTNGPRLGLGDRSMHISRNTSAETAQPDSSRLVEGVEGRPRLGPTSPAPNSHPSRQGVIASAAPDPGRVGMSHFAVRPEIRGRDFDGSDAEVTGPRIRASSESSDDTFFSTSSGRGGGDRLSPQPGATRGADSSTPPRRATTPKSRQKEAATGPGANATKSSLGLDSLTNAIVASNIASARRQPAAREHQSVPAPPVPRRRRKNLQPPPQASVSDLSRSRSRSPLKRPGMLHTLRSPGAKSDDEEARRHHERHRRRGSLGKKHVHHEGARRRWREQITVAERRRYEAVWASNRGLLLNSLPNRHGGGADDNSVVNIVVRDLWSRSKLPFDELAEVWDLVDLGQRGMLGKEEFVVGTWLIDQRLRGSKIPTRVSQSVWDSVKGLRIPAPGSSG